ncbi:MAG: tRNA 2-thiocytidine(32) synthetase TtcA [Candidatus Omnitrophota bacterium]|jgi:tRNA 2-thiocytidine biosynthesis protein TtcA|nr:MAG: tRNA 2-thiocytidine(32) synthetase TtcA [Candidatus Omnitrophota bacterium]
MPILNGSAYYISKEIGKAIGDYGLISDGDKIAVAVSGGKDSITLLNLLNERRKFAPVNYEIMAIHVDLGYPRSVSNKLKKYFNKIGVNYHIEKNDVLKKTGRSDISCFWCSWNRRKSLFESAARLGFSKVALGHHMDDIIETILMNMFFQGEISAMLPKQELFGGKITLIRPLAYVQECMIKKYTKEFSVEYDKCICPNSAISNRRRMRRIISQLKKACPDIKKNIFRSVRRVKADYLL